VISVSSVNECAIYSRVPEFSEHLNGEQFEHEQIVRGDDRCHLRVCSNGPRRRAVKNSVSKVLSNDTCHVHVTGPAEMFSEQFEQYGRFVQKWLCRGTVVHQSTNQIQRTHGQFVGDT
jgi:hypothetical protein